jgi:hypothetical protein
MTRLLRTAKEAPMARIIVTADRTGQHNAPVLLDESVYSVHLSTDHAARQLVERLVWALADAEKVERARSDREAPTQTRSRLAGAGVREVRAAA